jgi:hypothetical protein
MEVKEIVMLLGGSAMLSERMEVKQQAVCNWMNRGSIPPRHHNSIVKLLKKSGVKITHDELLEINRRGSLVAAE